MSDDKDKKIKLSFAVDSKGLLEARGALQALTRDVQALINTMNRAGTGLGSLLTGLSGKAASFGKPGGVGDAKPAVGLGIGTAIGKDAQALTSTAKAGTQAIDSLTRSMKSNFSGQIADIERLRRALESLETAYKNIAHGKQYGTPQLSGLPGSFQPGSLAEAAYSHPRGPSFNAMSPESKALWWGNSAQGGGGGGKGGFIDRMASFFGGDGGGGRRGFLGGALQTLGGGFGLPMGLLGGGAAAGAAAVGLAIMAANQNAARTTSNAEYRIQYGMDTSRNAARIGGSLGSLGMAMRGGDLASSMAWSQLKRAGALAERDQLWESRDRVQRAQAGMTGTAKYTGAVKDELARTAGAFGGEGKGTDIDPRFLEYFREKRGQTAQTAEEKAELVRNYVASRAKLSFFENQVYGEGMSNISMARAGGLGLGLNQAGKNYQLLKRQMAGGHHDPVLWAKSMGADTNLGAFKSSVTGRGWSPEEIVGARQALGGLAGRGLMGMAESMHSAQLGGFASAGNVIAAGAQFGTRDGLFRAAQRGMGHGGLDATAGSQIANAVAAQMMGGNYAGANGEAALSGLMSIASTGTTGGDMRAARMAASGLAEYGRNLTGQTDNLQMGINSLAANASGAKGYYAKRALMNMDPLQMIQALRSGEAPQYLKDQGIGIGELQRYNSFRNQYAFSRYVDAEGGGSAVSRSVAGVKAAGGVGSYLRSKLAGVKDPKERKRIIQQELERLGSARMATEGGTREANIGALMAEASTDKELAPDLKGKGAWAAGIKGTTEGDVAANQKKALEEFSKWQATAYDNLKKSITDIDANQNEVAKITKGLINDAHDLDQVIKVTTQAFLDLLREASPATAERLVKEQKHLAEYFKTKAAGPGTYGTTVVNPDGTVQQVHNTRRSAK